MESLAKSGWRLSPDWSPPEGVSKPKDLTNLALNTDIKDFGRAFLAEALAEVGSSGQGVLPLGPEGAVVQVTKIRNIAAPKSNEDSGVAPR